MNKKLGYQILELCGILLGNAILAFGIAAFVLPHGMIIRIVFPALWRSGVLLLSGSRHAKL